MRHYACVAGLSLSLACTPASPRPMTTRAPAHQDPMGYLRSTLTAWPKAGDTGRLAVTDPVRGRIAIYDSALVLLVSIRRGAREEAARIVQGLLALQQPDGSLPFSFALPRPDPKLAYVRSGAVAWVGYAAAEYLDADRGGPARAEAITLARGAATYLMERQVDKPGDPRDGLVRGGAGVLRYELAADRTLAERFEVSDIAWASVEHNVDAYFFLRALARVTGETRYAAAAARIGQGLARTWNGDRGQLARGVTESGLDGVAALDCASWGSIFLHASGDRARADTAASVADSSFASRDPRSGARGHRAQRSGPVLEGELLMRVLGPKLPASDWSTLDAVWPEGSAGVALAAWRVGRVERARAILDALEPLRGHDGSLPTSTVEIPFLFDTRPSIAATAWVELVRFELDRSPERPTFWSP